MSKTKILPVEITVGFTFDNEPPSYQEKNPALFEPLKGFLLRVDERTLRPIYWEVQREKALRMVVNDYNRFWQRLFIRKITHAGLPYKKWKGEEKRCLNRMK